MNIETSTNIGFLQKHPVLSTMAAFVVTFVVALGMIIFARLSAHEPVDLADHGLAAACAAAPASALSWKCIFRKGKD